MSFFDFLSDIVATVVDTAANAIGWVGEKVGDAIDFITGLGDRESYSGSSTAEQVDIECELAKFNKKIAKEADEQEKNRMSIVSEAFDKFIQCLRGNYPALVDKMTEEKAQLTKELQGTFADEIHKRVSENNDEFWEVLAMNPGNEKKSALKKKMHEFLLKAQQVFDKKVSDAMGKLNEELSERLSAELRKKEIALKKEETELSELIQDSENSQETVKKLEENFRYFQEVESGMSVLLERKG